MRFRNSSNERIRVNRINRAGSLPYEPGEGRINYQGFDPSLDGLCPCDYPVDVYLRNSTSSLLEKWRLTVDGGQTMIWASVTAILGNPATQHCSAVGWDSGRDFIYFNNSGFTSPYADATVVVQGYDSADGSISISVTHGTLRAAYGGAAGALAIYRLLAPRKGGGVYLGVLTTSGNHLVKVDNTGATTFTGAYSPNLIAAGYGSYTVDAGSACHPDGFVISTSTEANGIALVGDNLSLIAAGPAEAAGTSMSMADQLGNIYLRTGDSSVGVRKFDNTFTEVTTEQWPVSESSVDIAPGCAWVTTAGVSPETTGTVQPFIMLHDISGSGSEGLYDNEGNNLWVWGHPFPGLGRSTSFQRPRSYYNSIADAVETDFALGFLVSGTPVIRRYNHYGTEIASGTVPSGRTLLFAAGAESAIR